MSPFEQLTHKQSSQIHSALHNTLAKTKAHIRRHNEIPSAETVFDWFQQMCEYKIIKDKAPIDASNEEANKFETIFFFNKMRVYLVMEYEVREYRGTPYFNASFGHTFINSLDPDEYLDELEINYPLR